MSPTIKGLAAVLGLGGVALLASQLMKPGGGDVDREQAAVEAEQIRAAEKARDAEIHGIDAEDADLEGLGDLDQRALEIRFLNPMRKAMAGGSCKERSEAFARFMSAARQLDFVNVDIESYFGAGDNAFVNGYVPAMRKQCADEAYQQCVEEHDFSALWLLAGGEARTAELLGSADQSGFDKLLEQCLTFELEFKSTTSLAPMRGEFLAQTRVPLSRDQDAAAASGYVLTGQAPLTATAHGNAEGCALKGASPKSDFEAKRLAIFPDTSGYGALAREQARIRTAELALQEEEKDPEKKSPADSTRRAAARKLLQQDQAKVSAEYGKRAGKDMNKPLRIELDYIPGTISVLYHCTGMNPIEVGGYYAEWPKHPIYSKFEGKTPNLVFQRGDIQGGEEYARKTVQGEGEGARVSLTFILRHRPPRNVASR